MALINIKETNNNQEVIEDDVAIGIDLGTTHSVCAYFHDGNVKILGDSGNRLIPSIVAFDGDSIIVGNKARDILENKNNNVIVSVKRLMGKGVDDIPQIMGKIPFNINYSSNKNSIELEIGGKFVTPSEVSSYILSAIKHSAEKVIGKPVKKAVITVPAYFDDNARAETKKAAHMAGLDVLRIINEPTAAAVAYGLDKGSKGMYLVYDLGGGTFDVSLLKLSEGVFQVVATGGDTMLGGDDMDAEIAKSIGIKEIETNNLISLLYKCRKAKEELSIKDVVALEYEGRSYTITKEQFNELIKPLVDRTISICKNVISEAEVDISEIDGVILVGGSTRVPFVKDSISSFFKKEPLYSINPDEVVALGAGYQAYNLTEGRYNDDNSLLLDIIPLSLGVETVGGLVEKIIERHSPIPIAKAQEFTTYKDNQTAMTIHIVQGEREMVDKNRSLGKFSLKGIPHMPAGLARIRVVFTVDADGLLTVSAKEETTGISQSVEIKPTFGMDIKTMTNMVVESLENAQQDMQERLLNESKVSAERLRYAVEQALKKDGSMLDEKETDEINSAVEDLKVSELYEDRDDIEIKIARLQKVTDKFAEKRMNKSIQDAIKGKEIDKV